MPVSSTCCSCSRSPIINTNKNKLFYSIPLTLRRTSITRVSIGPVVRASNLDSSSNFAKRIETAWLISQALLLGTLQLLKKKEHTRKFGVPPFVKQPRPVACTVCVSDGHVECKWCRGTGFFILGDNMLCQVASHSTSCVICSGKGSVSCVDCKGTGFRAKWLEEPPMSKQ